MTRRRARRQGLERRILSREPGVARLRVTSVQSGRL
jgi:hypothetical protein